MERNKGRHFSVKIHSTTHRTRNAIKRPRTATDLRMVRLKKKKKKKPLSQCQVSVDLILNLHPVNHALPYLNTFTFSVSHRCSVWKDNVFLACTKSYSLAFLLQYFHYCIRSFTTMHFWKSIPFSMETRTQVCAEMMIYNGLTAQHVIQLPQK